MSENQIRAGGIALELANTKKNLMEAFNQNADLQKQVEEQDQRIKELEAEGAAVKGKVKDALGMLVAYTGEFPEVLSVAEKDLNKALSTPTGSKLLEKVEIADQIAEILLDHPDFKFSQVEIDELDDVLSRYRSVCKHKKESRESK